MKLLLLFRTATVKGDIPAKFTNLADGDVFGVRVARDSEAVPDSHRGLVVEEAGLKVCELRKAVTAFGGMSYFLNDKPVADWLKDHGLQLR